MSKKIKEMVMNEIDRELAGCRDVLLVDASKVDAITTNRWRAALRAKQIHALTVKNTLARKTLENKGVSGVESLFVGPTTLIWGGEDIVSLSKEIAKWVKEIEPLTIKGGALDGQALSSDDVDQLSKSPGRIELLGQIVTLILSPGARLAGALLGPGGTISGQAKALAEKDEASA